MSRLTRRFAVLAALGAGVLAALLAYFAVERQRAQAKEMGEPVTVVVAKEAIPARTIIEPGMVCESLRPAGTLPSNCATSVREVLGRVATSALAADEPVRRSAVASRTSSLGLSYVVPEGKRAVTVSLDPIIGVAGFLKPGDRVDVLATFETDDVSVTKTVLQHVELLATGPELSPPEANRLTSGKGARPKQQPNATVAVTPDEAEKLILAESEGKLRLILRPAGERTLFCLSGVRSDSLFGVRRSSEARPQRAAPAPRRTDVMPRAMPLPPLIATNARPEKAAAGGEGLVTVETIRGTERTTVDVPASSSPRDAAMRANGELSEPPSTTPGTG